MVEPLGGKIVQANLGDDDVKAISQSLRAKASVIESIGREDRIRVLWARSSALSFAWLFVVCVNGGTGRKACTKGIRFSAYTHRFRSRESTPQLSFLT